MKSRDFIQSREFELDSIDVAAAPIKLDQNGAVGSKPRKAAAHYTSLKKIFEAIEPLLGRMVRLKSINGLSRFKNILSVYRP